MCTQILNPQSVYHLRGSSDTSLTVSHTGYNVIKPIKICITKKKVSVSLIFFCITKIIKIKITHIQIIGLFLTNNSTLPYRTA